MMQIAPLIFIAQKGSINAVAKRDLRRAGVIVVECKYPSSCRLIDASAEISAGGLTRAAIESLAKHGLSTAHADFIRRLAHEISKSHEAEEDQ